MGMATQTKEVCNEFAKEKIDGVPKFESRNFVELGSDKDRSSTAFSRKYRKTLVQVPSPWLLSESDRFDLAP